MSRQPPNNNQQIILPGIAMPQQATVHIFVSTGGGLCGENTKDVWAAVTSFSFLPSLDWSGCLLVIGGRD